MEGNETVEFQEYFVGGASHPTGAVYSTVSAPAYSNRGEP